MQARGVPEDAVRRDDLSSRSKAEAQYSKIKLAESLAPFDP